MADADTDTQSLRESLRYHHPRMLLDDTNNPTSHIYHPTCREAVCGYQDLSPRYQPADLPRYHDLLDISTDIGTGDDDEWRWNAHGMAVLSTMDVPEDEIDIAGMEKLLPLPEPAEDERLCTPCRKIWEAVELDPAEITTTYPSIAGRALTVRAWSRDAESDPHADADAGTGTSIAGPRVTGTKSVRE